MTTGAGVSERVFYEVFQSVEECYRAAFEQGVERLSRTVAGASAQEQGWLERVRAGLVALLGFFDDEPAWARLLLVETPLSAALAGACRRRLYGVLAGLLEREANVTRGRGAVGCREGSPGFPGALTGELVVGGVFSVIRTSVLEADGARLVELAPSLMAFIVAPRFGEAAARAELEGRPSAQALRLADGAVADGAGLERARAISRAAELPIRVTHRTTMVLRAVARAPYSSNRELADAAGISDEGQISKLLARLERQGVIENVGVGCTRGEPNAWLLTPSGRRALALIADSPAAERRKDAKVRGKA